MSIAIAWAKYIYTKPRNVFTVNGWTKVLGEKTDFVSGILTRSFVNNPIKTSGNAKKTPKPMPMTR